MGSPFIKDRENSKEGSGIKILQVGLGSGKKLTYKNLPPKNSEKIRFLKLGKSHFFQSFLK